MKTPQSVALIALPFAGSLSVLFGTRWAWGALQAFPEFLPCALAFFLVVIHCHSKRKLQIVVLMLLFACLFVIANGYYDLRYGVPHTPIYLGEDSDIARATVWNIQHPYILEMENGAGEMIYRLRGQGLINDPNDFGQLTVCVIPLVFFFWRPKRTGRNLVCVFLPVAVLLAGTFLTHSRGALLALMAVAIMAARRRIGTLPAILVAAGVFVGALALNFTGGRGISADAGSDRTALWGEGLQMLKSHPLFGVGLDRMTDYTDSHLTAHNTVVVCAAELGLVGLFFWCLFLFPTVRDALAVASLGKPAEAEPVTPLSLPPPDAAVKMEMIDELEVGRLGRLVVLSLTGFLVAGWFLSRAYVLTFFLIGGIAEVVFEMALERGMIAPRLRASRVIRYSAILAFSLVMVMYVMLRTANLMH
ncbi:MAG: O-antigen ligase family protein [Terracidiphilus sp.]